MLQSRLSRWFIIIALGTIGIWADADVGGKGQSSPRAAQVPRDGEPLLWNNFEHVVVKKDDIIERLIVERIPDSTDTSPKERAAPALSTPRPTAPPQKRQDDGQIQALSSQLRSLSQSATQAISSVSSSASSAISLVSQSAQSVRQSADQAVQSANQNADNANRQLSQTQSSASSAMSAASSRASTDLQRSLSSMSSRISSNLESAQSSASSAISSARAAASSSAANAVNLAASQIQEARADASGSSGVKGDTNSAVTQVQGNSVSGTTVAIIVTVSVVGTAVLTAIAAFFIVRYRRKKQRDREGLATAINTSNEKQYEKPIAVRGTTPGSPRFTPFGGGTGYPMDKFKLPDLTLSPFLRKKTNEDGRSSIGFARSDYDVPVSGGAGGNNSDVYGVSPTSFRLQKKDASVKSATTVRLIRVGSTNKDKTKARDDDERALLSPILSPAPPLPVQTPAPPAQPIRVVVPPSPSPPPSPQPPQRKPIAPPSPSEPPSPTSPPLAAPPPAATRSPRASVASDSFPAPPVYNQSRRATATMANVQSRLRFRDSSDVESAEPSPLPVIRTATATTVSSMRNTNTASLRSGRPKNAGPASFATFPRVRDGPPRGSAAEALMGRSRGLGGVAARLREEERRQRETETAGSASREEEEAEAAMVSKGPNWPFESA
ncbi:hypothetical protein F4818DRAFT_436213 [Hypoxylon cercidicola]|nr:hypothetical protein F4818DRAFT_436213 [Hypoxylon cercidicola]